MRKTIQVPTYIGRKFDHWARMSHVAQWLTVTIAQDVNIDSAGITFYLPGRWSNTCTDLTEERVEEAALELVEHGELIVDGPDGDHCWLVNYMFNNGVFRQPNALRGALRAASEARSPVIREAIARYLAELPEDYFSGPGLAVRRRRDVAPALRLHVYERDEWTCQDCARCIPPLTAEQWRGDRAPFDDQGWLELDHIHPHSDDGPDTADNLRALCSSCNRIKGARTLLGVPA